MSEWQRFSEVVDHIEYRGFLSTLFSKILKLTPTSWAAFVPSMSALNAAQETKNHDISWFEADGSLSKTIKLERKQLKMLTSKVKAPGASIVGDKFMLYMYFERNPRGIDKIKLTVKHNLSLSLTFVLRKMLDEQSYSESCGKILPLKKGKAPQEDTEVNVTMTYFKKKNILKCNATRISDCITIPGFEIEILSDYQLKIPMLKVLVSSVSRFGSPLKMSGSMKNIAFDVGPEGQKDTKQTDDGKESESSRTVVNQKRGDWGYGDDLVDNSRERKDEQLQKENSSACHCPCLDNDQRAIPVPNEVANPVANTALPVEYVSNATPDPDQLAIPVPNKVANMTNAISVEHGSQVDVTKLSNKTFIMKNHFWSVRMSVGSVTTNPASISATINVCMNKTSRVKDKFLKNMIRTVVINVPDCDETSKIEIKNGIYTYKKSGIYSITTENEMELNKSIKIKELECQVTNESTIKINAVLAKVKLGRLEIAAKKYIRKEDPREDEFRWFEFPLPIALIADDISEARASVSLEAATTKPDNTPEVASIAPLNDLQASSVHDDTSLCHRRPV